MTLITLERKDRYTKRVQTTISSLHPSLRRERDSNPRYLAVQRISRPPHSTTLPSLRGHHEEKANDFSSLMHCKDTYSHRVNEIPPRQEQHKTGGYLRAFTLGQPPAFLLRGVRCTKSLSAQRPDSQGYFSVPASAAFTISLLGRM